MQLNHGKIQLVKGAVPTEFWVDILQTSDEQSDCDDTQDMNIHVDIDLQIKYNELQQLRLKNELDFNVREASLQKKTKI